MLPLADLRPWEQNYRHHPAEQLDRIRESLRRNGQRKAVVVQASTMRIIAGHGVAEALRLEGYTEARCDVWDCTDEQAAAYLVDDNELSRHAVDDEAQLSALLLELQDTQFAPVAFDEADIAFLVAEGQQRVSSGRRRLRWNLLVMMTLTIAEAPGASIEGRSMA